MENKKDHRVKRWSFYVNPMMTLAVLNVRGLSHIVYGKLGIAH